MTALSTFSSSVVWEAVAHDGHTAVLDTATDTISPTTLEQLASDLSAQIDRSARRAARRARKAADFLTGVGIYDDLTDKHQRRAAEVVELFRDGRITSNAGHLDARTLQRRLVQAIHEGGPLVYELGWGQAKRSVGGLKTEGAGADLAELVAIARLAAITRASQILLNEPVILRILSGGRRFYEALFTRPQADEAYNDQRAAVTSLLGQDDVVSVRREEFGDSIKLRERLAASNVAPHPVPSAAQLRFMQLSIDWEHLFELADEHPHGLPPPAGFSSIWAHLPRTERDVLLRCLFRALVHGSDTDASGHCRYLLDEQTFQRAVDWMVDVARESAIKYALLSEITRRDSGTKARDPRTGRLTVIEKEGQPEVPVLTLLGSRSGNCLPQHVVPMIQAERDRIVFSPRMAVPASHRLVQVSLAGEPPQPLFFTDTSARQALETLRRSDIVDIG